MRRGQGAGGRAATGRGRLAIRRGWRRHTTVFAIANVEWKFLPFVLVWNCRGPTDWVGNGWRGSSMVTVSHNTAAGAGLWVTGILPPRSIPIDVESSLEKLQFTHFSDAWWHLCRTYYKSLSSIQYLGHMWWQLRTYEANVIMVDGGVDSWDHCGSWRWLTRDAWIMAHVAVIPRFLHLAGPTHAKETNY